MKTTFQLSHDYFIRKVLTCHCYINDKKKKTVLFYSSIATESVFINSIVWWCLEKKQLIILFMIQYGCISCWKMQKFNFPFFLKLEFDFLKSSQFSLFFYLQKHTKSLYFTYSFKICFYKKNRFGEDVLKNEWFPVPINSLLI